MRIDPNGTRWIVTNNLIHHFVDTALLVTNQGSATLDNNILGQNPLLVNANSIDFRLQPNSPAIGKAVVLTEVKTDFTGSPRDPTTPDLGAFEYTKTDPPPIEPPSLARSESMTSNSNNFDPTNPVDNLWDSCTSTEDRSCWTGAADIPNFWVEFDFGEPHRLSSARLFGDAENAWVSTSWSLLYKVNASDAWNDAFVDSNALVNGWVSRELDVLARFARVEVKGAAAGTGTQAQELEIHGEPEACTASTEQCDGMDNDCDGKVDEDWPTLGEACTTGLGACSQQGVVVCDAEAQATTCSAVGLTPAPEVCDDGVDNDCDGKVDAVDPDCQSGVCPENTIVVNPGEAHPDELTVVVHDADGNPLTCTRIAADLGAVGCAMSSRMNLLCILLPLGFLMMRRRPRMGRIF
ncbi:MAG: discoidin domain-containing protein [Myxococcota bacterium]